MTPMERLVQRLRETEGDPQAQAAVAAEFLLAGRPEAERASLAAGLDAAAVLRWFDPGLLGRVLELDAAAAGRLHQELSALPFVEPYPGRAPESRNLHEATRLGWRRKLAAEQPQRLRALSLKAADCFAEDSRPAGQTEWIYQRLAAAPDQAAGELADLNRDWSSRARPEERYALAGRLQELVDTALVRGRAELWCRLVIAWSRVERGETARLQEPAAALLEQARSAADLAALAEAHCLYGDVMQTQGQLAAALAAFQECLAISRRLAELDPGNADWQQDLAMACIQMARLEGRLRHRKTALAYYEEATRLFAALLKRAPEHVGWQQERELLAREFAAFRRARK